MMINSDINVMINSLPLPPAGKNGWPWNDLHQHLAADRQDEFICPKISIITPSYNQGQFLESTIRSILLQGYPNLEYIIIDGGSTDKSIEIIRKYEPFLAYWHSRKDNGQSDALNQGFSISTGDLMGWICSDDMLEPNALCQLASCYQRGKHWWIGSASQLLQDGSIFSFDSSKTFRITENDLLHARAIIPQPAIFWTRELCSNSHFKESAAIGRDFQL